MCAIAYFLESEGIMTTGIALVRENAESMQPPRMLWVTFPLGRPLGKPGDAEFQKRVILGALDLLQRKQGPVLEDYPEDAPEVAGEIAAACPVHFSRQGADESTWQTRLAEEFRELSPWYDLSLRRRGRTTVGVSNTSVDAILKTLGELADNPEQPPPETSWLKQAIEDAKAFYQESLTAQPGAYTAASIQKWLWDESALGGAMRLLYERFRKVEALRQFTFFLAPRSVVGGATGSEPKGNPRTERK